MKRNMRMQNGFNHNKSRDFAVLSAVSTLAAVTPCDHFASCVQLEQLEADREQLRSGFDRLVHQQQERAAEWEEAVKLEEAALGKHKQACGDCSNCLVLWLITAF